MVALNAELGCFDSILYSPVRLVASAIHFLQSKNAAVKAKFEKIKDPDSLRRSYYSKLNKMYTDVVYAQEAHKYANLNFILIIYGPFLTIFFNVCSIVFTEERSRIFTRHRLQARVEWAPMGPSCLIRR